MTTLEAALRRIHQVPVKRRKARVAQLANTLFDDEAETCFAELLAQSCLARDEADLLECLAERLERPVVFRYAALVAGQGLEWQEGKIARHELSTTTLQESEKRISQSTLAV